jgi:hypothetical protein
MGAAGGATAGLAVASLAIPGIGPLLAFGMVGAALLGIVGAAAGSAVGDQVEEGLGEGIPTKTFICSKMPCAMVIRC